MAEKKLAICIVNSNALFLDKSIADRLHIYRNPDTVEILVGIRSQLYFDKDSDTAEILIGIHIQRERGGGSIRQEYRSKQNFDRDLDKVDILKGIQIQLDRDSYSTKMLIQLNFWEVFREFGRRFFLSK